MAWNSLFPVGNSSVKNNETIGQQNTTYIEETMGNQIVGTNPTPQTAMDHFWDVDPNLDGRHRFMQSPAFVNSGGDPANPVIAPSMDGVLFLKEITGVGRVEGFYSNAEGTYQYIPSVKTGTINPLGATYQTIVDVPANCYGTIFMYASNQGANSCQMGYFRSGAAIVETWATAISASDSSSATFPLKFLNGASAVDLDIKARRSASDETNWTYIVKYRAL